MRDRWSRVKLAMRTAALLEKRALSAVPKIAPAAAPAVAPKPPKTQPKVGELPPLGTHQTRAIDFTLKRGGSSLVVAPTGSGKTRTFSELGKRLRASQGGSTLHITPAALRTNAAKGITKWTPGTNVQIVRHLKDKIPVADAAVISYEMFKKRGKEFADAGYQTAIFDEIQKAKDEETGTFKSLLESRRHFKNYVGFTASLNSLDPSDMIQPISAITNGRHDLGSREQFRHRFLKTRGEEVGWLGSMRLKPDQQKEIVGFKNEDELGRRLQQYVHYTGPDDLDPDLFPKKETEVVEVEMSPAQSKLYGIALRRLPPEAMKALDSEGAEGDITHVYNSLIQARALSGGVHTMVPGMSLSDSWRLTPKTSKIVEDIRHHLGETKDGRVVVVTNMVRGGVDVMSQAMKDTGVPFGVFMGKGKGGQSETERQQALMDFNAGKLQVLVASPAGHEGLDAPDATMVVGMDGHFNPEHVIQQEARGVRAHGQSNRPQEERRVVVRRYVSVLPQSDGIIARIQRALGYGKRQRSVDERIYDVAAGRHTLNKGVEDILQGQKPKQHAL